MANNETDPEVAELVRSLIDPTALPTEPVTRLFERVTRARADIEREHAEAPWPAGRERLTHEINLVARLDRGQRPGGEQLWAGWQKSARPGDEPARAPALVRLLRGVSEAQVARLGRLELILGIQPPSGRDYPSRPRMVELFGNPRSCAAGSYVASNFCHGCALAELFDPRLGAATAKVRPALLAIFAIAAQALDGLHRYHLSYGDPAGLRPQRVRLALRARDPLLITGAFWLVEATQDPPLKVPERPPLPEEVLLRDRLRLAASCLLAHGAELRQALALIDRGEAEPRAVATDLILDHAPATEAMRAYLLGDEADALAGPALVVDDSALAALWRAAARASARREAEIAALAMQGDAG